VCVDTVSATALVVTASGDLEEILAYQHRCSGSGTATDTVSRTRVPTDVAVRDVYPSPQGYDVLGVDGSVWSLTLPARAGLDFTMERFAIRKPVAALTHNIGGDIDRIFALEGGGVALSDGSSVPDVPDSIDTSTVSAVLPQVWSGDALVHENGRIDGWGLNLGARLSFPRVVMSAHIVQLETCGFSVAIDDMGTIYTWADSGTVEGLGPVDERVEGVLSGGEFLSRTALGCLVRGPTGVIGVLRVDGSVDPLSPPALPDGDNIARVGASSGTSQSVLGPPSPDGLAPVTALSVGALAVTAQGRLIVWGTDGSVVQLTAPTAGAGVVAVAASGTGSAVTGSAPRAPLQLIDAPMAVGEMVEGRSLHAVHGDFTYKPVDEVLYQWRRDGQPIDGATTMEHTLTDEDVGHEITVAVSARWDGYPYQDGEPSIGWAYGDQALTGSHAVSSRPTGRVVGSSQDLGAGTEVPGADESAVLSPSGTGVHPPVGPRPGRPSPSPPSAPSSPSERDRRERRPSVDEGGDRGRVRDRRLERRPGPRPVGSASSPAEGPDVVHEGTERPAGKATRGGGAGAGPAGAARESSPTRRPQVPEDLMRVVRGEAQEASARAGQTPPAVRGMPQGWFVVAYVALGMVTLLVATGVRRRSTGCTPPRAPTAALPLRRAPVAALPCSTTETTG